MRAEVNWNKGIRNSTIISLVARCSRDRKVLKMGVQLIRVSRIR